MRTLKLALLATVAVAGVSTAASAADLIVDTPAPAPVVVDNYSPVDWNGPYAGLFISGQTDSIFGLGADLGVNAMISDNLLIGGEASLQWLNNDDGDDDGNWQGQVNGKVGFAASNFAFYGLAGIGTNSDTEAYVPVGVGAEVKLTENLSLKAEYQYQWDLDDENDNAHVGKVGFNFHF